VQARDLTKVASKKAPKKGRGELSEGRRRGKIKYRKGGQCANETAGREENQVQSGADTAKN